MSRRDAVQVLSRVYVEAAETYRVLVQCSLYKSRCKGPR